MNLPNCRGAAGFFCLFTVLACENYAPSAPASGQGKAISAMTLLGYGSNDYDDQLLQISSAVPSFAGVAFDSIGTLRIFVTDLSQADAAMRAVQPLISSNMKLPRAQHVEKVKYAFSELKDWETRLIPAMTYPGVVFLDADEANNRVTIGLLASADRSRIDAIIGKQAIPSDGVQYVVTKPIRMLATLSGGQRPLRAGFQFEGVARFGNDSTEQEVCTFALNTHFSSAPQTEYGVVNSHCVPPMGALGADSDVLYQPALFTAPNIIGKEYLDPPFISSLSGCPAGRLCRRSDAALFRYNTGVAYEQGAIARTQCRNCSDVTPRITIDPSKPKFNIVQTADYPYAGQWLNKMGSVTGWTYGVVTNSCVIQNVNDENGDTGKTVLCNYLLNGANTNGDSGSPVFELDAQDGALLEGIMWGGDGANLIVMSPVKGIQLDLGTNLVFNQNQ